IMRAGRSDNVKAHFVGSVVYIEHSDYDMMDFNPAMLIDGQQRLTTVSLLLEALARQVGDGEPVDGFSARKLRHYYLLNREEEGDRRFKLVLTQTDRDTLIALVRQKQPPHDASLRITDNFNFFDSKIKALSGADIQALCSGLAKLLIVGIALSKDH